MTSEGFDPALGAGYRLVRRIGAGASGEVWLAVDTRTSEEVAAKLLRPEHAADHEIVTRFIAERQVLTSLRHPNIVAVRDLVVEGDRVAIVMNYVPGGSLRDLLNQRRTLAPHEAAGLTALVLEALAAAHEKGVLHRDVKPDNVLLSDDWQSLAEGEAKLTDFGIARLVEASTRMTTGLVGTPEYMAPEFIATGDCTLPADVYAAGIMLYELLAGRTPFAGSGNAFAIAQRHLSSLLPPIPVPEALWQQLERMLDKDPDTRPAAAVAAAGLRRLGEKLAGLPALEPAAKPERFEIEDRPATMLRGALAPQSDAGGVEGAEADLGPAEPAPELGESSHATVYRQPSRPAVTARPARKDPHSPRVAWWKNPKIIAGTVGAVVLAGAFGLYFATQSGGPSDDPETVAPPPATTSATAVQHDSPTRAGLTISRTARWEPDTGRATVTITYTAQNAPLGGPFLEVLPGLSKTGPCPSVSWSGGSQKRNLPSATGITASCGWAVDPGNLAAQASQSIEASLPLNLSGSDAQSQLQDWLNAAAEATANAVADETITSTVYPVQRLQDIQVTTPPSVVTQTALPITLIPVWPSGGDTLNPLLQTATIGEPSTMLKAIAGGIAGVRFSDNCSGAVAIASDGLSVTTLSQTPSCTLGAQVGNFTNLSSPPFAIVNRGG